MDIRDLFFPKRCVGCGKVGAYFCDSCIPKIRHVAANEHICPVCGRLALSGATHPKCMSRYAPDGLTSFFRYRGPVQSAVKVLKYRRVSDAAFAFVALIADAAITEAKHAIEKPAVLIPIPLYAKRQNMRGFNQSEVLARYLLKRLQIPLVTDILYRTRKTDPQADIKTRRDRLKNMENVFACRQKDIPGNIVLFDDVFTTGATIRAAAYALKRAGAKRIWAVTMAR